MTKNVEKRRKNIPVCKGRVSMKGITHKKLTFYFGSENGLSLIEILASVTLLFILILTLIPMFVQSARTNNVSAKVMDATYLAESSMELIENSVNTSTAIDSSFTTSIGSNGNGFTQTVNGCSSGTCYEKSSNGHYVFVQITNSPSGSSLVDARVKVYTDSTKSTQQAQMETLLSLKK
jgi:Tfp pilus assembly protein PilV